MRARVAVALALGGALAVETCDIIARALAERGVACERARGERALEDALERCGGPNGALLVLAVETDDDDEPPSEAARVVREIFRRAGGGGAVDGAFACACVAESAARAARAAWRSDQTTAEDCHAVGLAVETAVRRGMGMRRVGSVLMLDRSREEEEAWVRGASARARAWAEDVARAWTEEADAA